jgi:hypothetical protein
VVVEQAQRKHAMRELSRLRRYFIVVFRVRDQYTLYRSLLPFL